MGCKTCKEKKNSNQTNKKNMNRKNSDTVNLVPEEIINGDFSGNFMFKVVAFIVMIIAIPLIIIVLIGQVFLTFFMPKSLPKIRKRFKSFWGKLFMGYARRKHDKEFEKRRKQFMENKGYEEGSELIDIEDYSEINIHEKNNEED